MVALWFILIVLAVFVGMEGVAWGAHRYIMHGWGWGWHRSHHEPRTGLFETNDLYAVVGAGVGFGLFLTAWLTGSWPVYAVATGVTLYGVVYEFVHDGLVHQRWPFRWMPRNGYARRLVQAHKLHHAVQTKEDAVSFGFLLAPDPHRLKAVLSERRAARLSAEALRPGSTGQAAPAPTGPDPAPASTSRS